MRFSSPAALHRTTGTNSDRLQLAKRNALFPFNDCSASNARAEVLMF